MSDELQKLMAKLKKPIEEVKEEVVEEVKEEVVEDPKEEEQFNPNEDDADDEAEFKENKEEDAPKEVKEEVKEEVVEDPKEEDNNSIGHEVALLQNNGVFRRELLNNLRELVDVHKVNTQTLIDIKNLVGGSDAKGK